MAELMRCKACQHLVDVVTFKDAQTGLCSDCRYTLEAIGRRMSEPTS